MIEQATLSQLPQIMEVYAKARAFALEHGINVMDKVL